MMTMMLLRRRTLLKSSSFLNRHMSSTWNQYEDEKDVYRTVRSLIRSSELNKAVEYARSRDAERSRRATKVAICELVVPALYDAKRYKDVARLIFNFRDSRLYHSLDCLNLVRRAWEKVRLGASDDAKEEEAEAKRCELNKCLVSNPPPPYPIIILLGGGVIMEPPKNQYFDESHLYSTVRFLIQNLSDLDTAMEYARFTAFTTSRTATTTATCDLIITALCEAKRYTDAYHLFHYFFNQSNISLSLDSCNHIVKALCHDGHAYVALQHHHHIICGDDDHALDYQTYRILTKALYLSGKLDEALDLVKDIFSLNNPDKYNSVFLDQKDFDKAWALCCEELINGNNNNDGYPTVTKTAVKVTLIEYHLSKGDDDKAMEIYTCLVAETSGNIEDASKRPLLDVLFKYGKETQAWSLVENHHQERETNLFHCQQPPTFCEHKTMDRFEHVRKMQDFIMPKFNHAPYTNVITRCCQDGNTLSHAKLILDEMLNHDPSAYKISTFQELINAFLKAGRLDDALEAANMMVDANLRLVSILMKS